MQLRKKIILVYLFILCNSTILQAQTLDDWFVLSTQNSLINWLNKLDIPHKVKVDFPDANLKFSLEDALIKNKYQILQQIDSTQFLITVEQKGDFIIVGNQIHANGVLLFRLFRKNELYKSERIILKEDLKKQQFLELKSSYWNVTTQDSSNQTKSNWFEPSIIISVMAVTIYLLFAVRS